MLGKISLITFLFSMSFGLHAAAVGAAKESDKCMAFVHEIANRGASETITEAKIQAILTDEKELQNFSRRQLLKIHPDKCHGTQESCGHEVVIRFEECIKVLQRRSATSKNKATVSSTTEKAISCLYKDENYCKSHEHDCIWDEQANYCLDKTWSSCSSAQEVGSCEKLGCAWDARGGVSGQCLSKNLSRCQSANSSNACTQIHACVWDNVAKHCLSNQTSKCATSKSPTACKDIGCNWLNKDKVCVKKSKFCEDLPGEFCEHYDGCVWDHSQKYCLSTSESWCYWSGEEHSCDQIHGCKWTGSRCGRE